MDSKEKAFSNTRWKFSQIKSFMFFASPTTFSRFFNCNSEFFGKTFFCKTILRKISEKVKTESRRGFKQGQQKSQMSHHVSSLAKPLLHSMKNWLVRRDLYYAYILYVHHTAYGSF